MGGRSFDILPAASADVATIVPLMASFNEGEGILWRRDLMTAALHRLLREPSLGLVLVARDTHSGAALGYGLATFGFDIEFAGADAFITELFVAPVARRRGVGCGLLDALVRTVRDRGAGAVHLMVRPENERARALYESRGFRPVPRLLMTKILAADGS